MIVVRCDQLARGSNKAENDQMQLKGQLKMHFM